MNDKICSERTLELAWAKVQSTEGACGVDGITVDRFGKDNQRRLLAVREQQKGGTYQPQPVKRACPQLPTVAAAPRLIYKL